MDAVARKAFSRVTSSTMRACGRDPGAVAGSVHAR